MMERSTPCKGAPPFTIISHSTRCEGTSGPQPLPKRPWGEQRANGQQYTVRSRGARLRHRRPTTALGQRS